jgi:hypothetical protein
VLRVGRSGLGADSSRFAARDLSLPNLRELSWWGDSCLDDCLSLLNGNVHNLTVYLPGFPESPAGSRFMDSIGKVAPSLKRILFLVDEQEEIEAWRVNVTMLALQWQGKGCLVKMQTAAEAGLRGDETNGCWCSPPCG